MEKAYQKNMVLARGNEAFIGIDVHKESWHTTVLVEGEEKFNGRIPGQYPALKKLIERFKRCNVKVAYEAGPCGFWLYDRLTEDKVDTIVVPPSLIPVESGNRVKTDKRDSRKLAKLLENNMLKKVHVLTEEERADRELLRTRRQVMNHRNDVARQIKSKLLFHGINPPFTGKQRWTKKYIHWLKALTFKYEAINISFKSLIELYEYLSGQIINIDKEVIKLSESETYRDKVSLLRSVPGIGIIISMEILVELQDLWRFGSGKKIASYLGLTPSEYSTGQFVRQGRITRCGNKRVRTCLVESSWYLIRKDAHMRDKYNSIKNSRGAKRAIIAISRSLIIRIRAMFLLNKPYEVGIAA